MKELMKAIEDASAAYHEALETKPRREAGAAADKVVEARKALAAFLAKGAEPCPTCGAAPHGMAHQAAAGKRTFYRYEVGCLNCRDHHADGVTREAAVDGWNKGRPLQVNLTAALKALAAVPPEASAVDEIATAEQAKAALYAAWIAPKVSE